MNSYLFEHTFSKVVFDKNLPFIQKIICEPLTENLQPDRKMCFCSLTVSHYCETKPNMHTWIVHRINFRENKETHGGGVNVVS